MKIGLSAEDGYGESHQKTDTNNKNLFLTGRTIHAASSADYSTDEFCAAAFTKLSIMPVYLQKGSVAIVLPLSPQVLLRSDTVLLNKIRQTFRNFRSQAPPLLRRYMIRRAGRPDVCLK